MSRRSGRRSRTAARKRKGETQAPPRTSFIVLLVALAGAAVILDDPGHWTTGYGLLRHAEWEGADAADLLSPIFLFFLGASIPLLSERARWTAVVLRAALLIGIGLLVSGYPRFDLSTWRIPGVLQRAGLCYIAAAAAYRATSGDRRRRGAIMVSLATFLTLAYWLVMTHVPVPGGTADDLSPEGNLAAWADRVLLGGHVWSARWDPDGLLSTLSSLSTTMFGVVAGMCVTSDQRPARKAAQLAGAGVAGIAGGMLWTPMFPLNRTLWSSSFVIFSGGVASLLLAIWYWTASPRR
jgi:predicted acyltransferase